MSLAGALKARGRCGFVPFLALGDPNLKATEGFVRALCRAGADIIELGVPFSDPVADGPAIQAAYQRALKSGMTLEKALGFAAALRRRGERTPIILFTYLNPVLSMGSSAFAARCAESGVTGVLVVDLPLEEAGRLIPALKRHGVEPVMLASPTTSDDRLREIGAVSGSLVYYVCRQGVTGARKDLASGLQARLKRVRRLTGKPLIVGFGISTPGQARALGRLCDGIVVGSALVAQAAKASGRAGLARLARRLVSALES